MVKKFKKRAERQAAAPTGLLDSRFAHTVKDSAQQIWLAGLGAFAKAQGEGSKVFDTLMKEGANLHRKTQSAAEEKLGDVVSKMSAMAGGVGQKANAQWDKLETIFEERTARAMSSLGVPTAKDMAALAERVEALAAALAGLGTTAGVAKAAAQPAAKTPARKAAAPAAVVTEASAMEVTKTAAKLAAKAPLRKAAAPAPIAAKAAAKAAAKPAAKAAGKVAAKPARKRRATRVPTS